jgi:hypothetical protein
LTIFAEATMKKLVQIEGDSYMVEFREGGEFVVSKKGAKEITLDEVLIVLQKYWDETKQTREK